MSTVTSPAEQRVVLSNVSWDTYERLLKDLENSSTPHLTFSEGVLEIMSPRREHEECNRNLALMVEIFAEEFEIEIANLGSTTFKREDLERGFEADSCFYIQNEARMRGKRDIDAAVDPPPDLVVEIDLTSDSIDKFPIFAKFNVPEVWRYSKGQVTICTLEGDKYQQQPASCALPLLTASDLTALLKSSASMKRTEWLHHLRAHFQNVKSRP